MISIAWARMIVASKNHMNEQIRICNSYVRWKWRSRILTILKVWRHQALYGRIDGLYSRQMLLKTLAEQKFAANTLQKIMADQTIELEECRMIANTEIDKRKKIEEELQEANKVSMIIYNVLYIIILYIIVILNDIIFIKYHIRSLIKIK